MAKTTKKTKKKSKQQIQNSLKIKNKLKNRKLGLAKYTQPNSAPKKRRGQSNEEKSRIQDVRQHDKSLSLVDRCKMKMSSSLLRLMDEDLYKSDTKNVSLDRERFFAYHKAYASVREKWPVHPIDFIVKFIKKRILSRKSHHRLRFADIGCGQEPLLKQRLPTKVKVVSYDLVSTHKDITQANMESLPLDNESIDCAVYSLSLMAKNLGKVILEGKRVLKLNGSVLIVEVTSRFKGDEKKFTSKMERLGFKQKSLQVLEPNGCFTFFHFTKKDNELDYTDSASNIQLKPCAYKAR